MGFNYVCNTFYIHNSNDAISSNILPLIIVDFFVASTFSNCNKEATPSIITQLNYLPERAHRLCTTQSANRRLMKIGEN